LKKKQERNLHATERLRRVEWGVPRSGLSDAVSVGFFLCGCFSCYNRSGV
jgi:hypothetical protein